MITSTIPVTPAEEIVLELLWKENRPLTSVDMTTLSSDWKKGYIHIVIRSLMGKGMIEECGTVLYGNRYARAFRPIITREEYAAKLTLLSGITKEMLPQYTIALAKELSVTDKKKIINELNTIIDSIEKTDL